MSHVRDPNGRLGDLARYVLSELGEIEADFFTESLQIRTSEDLGRKKLIGVDGPLELLRDGAQRLATRLEGYMEMPEAKSQREARRVEA